MPECMNTAPPTEFSDWVEVPNRPELGACPICGEKVNLETLEVEE